MREVEVFAVEDTAVQVCWDVAPHSPVEVVARWHGGSAAASCVPAGPGGVVVSGLPPSTSMSIELGGVRHHVTTLAPPPGRVLSRFATINDMHIGAVAFGSARPLWNDNPYDPAPVRCTRAAITEALAWGADALVVKGDMTQRARVSEWEKVGELLSGVGIPILMIEGNHETKKGAIDGRSLMAGFGIELAVDHPTHLDLAGVRIVTVPTALWHVGAGGVRPEVLQAAAALLRDAPGGAVAALHHYPQRFRYPTLYPRGIPGPYAREILDTIAAAHPATLVLVGHSHRHRRHDHGPLMVAETGSTKDFPGSWAGYTVFEGGILQTTRRVLEPSAIAWTARGRRVLGGVWGVWASGLRSHRCFAYTWPCTSTP